MQNKTLFAIISIAILVIAFFMLAYWVPKMGAQNTRVVPTPLKDQYSAIVYFTSYSSNNTFNVDVQNTGRSNGSYVVSVSCWNANNVKLNETSMITTPLEYGQIGRAKGNPPLNCYKYEVDSVGRFSAPWGDILLPVDFYVNYLKPI